MTEYINRDAYIRYLSSRKAEFVDDYGKGWSAGINTAIKACEKFPAVDVAPVRYGHWEEWLPGMSVILTGEEMLYMCSNCTAKYEDVEGMRYCHNCGAKMDEEVHCSD